MTNPIKPAAAQASPRLPAPSTQARATPQASPAKAALRSIALFCAVLLLAPVAVWQALFAPITQNPIITGQPRILIAAHFIGRLIQYAAISLLAIVAYYFIINLFNIPWAMPDVNYPHIIIVIMFLIFFACLPYLLPALLVMFVYAVIIISIVWASTFLIAQAIMAFNVHIATPIAEGIIFIVTLGGLI